MSTYEMKDSSLELGIYCVYVFALHLFPPTTCFSLKATAVFSIIGGQVQNNTCIQSSKGCLESSSCTVP